MLAINDEFVRSKKTNEIKIDTPSSVSVNVDGLRKKAKCGEKRRRTVVGNETNVCRRSTVNVYYVFSQQATQFFSASICFF